MQQLELWSLRWRGGRHSWRHRHEGGFRSELYDVAAITKAEFLTLKAFVVAHHYAHNLPPTARCYGLFQAGRLVGAAALTNPMRDEVLTNVFPDLTPLHESFELGRFVLLDEVPANGESWFWARCRELARREGIRGIVAFSDPAPRRVAGELRFRGHWGCAYQGGGARYLGRGTPRWLDLRSDGTALSARTIQKARSGEQGHAYATELIAAAERDGGTRRVWHAGNHRYAWCDDRVRVAMTEQPYPKCLDPELVR